MAERILVSESRGKIGKANVSVNGVDANAAKVLHFDWKQGSDATIASLGPRPSLLSERRVMRG